jgi:hypothetical protein
MATIEDKRHGDTRRSWGYVVFVDGSRRAGRRSRGPRGRRMVAVEVRSLSHAGSVIARGLKRAGIRSPRLVTRIEDLPSRAADHVTVVNERVAPRWYAGS